ncbi:MAG TPA: D-alanine--D-alanine ligase, partial [Acidobacteriota bacterium]|nr:D-alanine--D-alanine ligase [Acidobacteriota bacterium]
PVPAFAVFPLNKKPKRPARLEFPLLVKSLLEDGSTGISQASIVKEDEALSERVEFIHRSTRGPAIAEQYIDGREIYVAVLGNQRLQTFPPWELVLQNLPSGAPYIATSKLKWDKSYQKRIGLETKPADLPQEVLRNLDHVSKRIYRSLHLSGYARIDYRLTEDGRLYLLEANPNPDISRKEDLAESARHSGVGYEDLLQKILNLGLSYRSDRIPW